MAGDTISFARGAPSADILPHEAVREAAASGACRGLGKGALLRDRDRPSGALRVDRRAARWARRLAGDGRQRLAGGRGDAVRAPARARRPGRRRAADLRPHAAAPAAARRRAGAGAAGGRRPRPRAPSRRRSPTGPIKLAHVIPNVHNPAGCTLSAAKRVRLVELAVEHGFWIFEDDPYRELPFEGEALETMLSIDRAERVIHASSFSKTVSPGVRVGYLVGPAGEIAKLAKRANETYISPNMLAEAIVLELCRSGELDRNIDFVKGALSDRRDALVAALREQIPEAEFVVPGRRLLPLARPRRGHRHDGAAGRGQGRGRRLRRRPRLHDRGRRQQPPPLLRPRAAGADRRGGLSFAAGAGAYSRCFSRLNRKT